MKKIVLSNEAFALVDDEDFEKLNQYKWYQHLGYAIRGVGKSKAVRHIRMHRSVIGDPPAGMVVDHKNRNKLDNRRENLRFVTKSMNGYNRPNTTGVYWCHGKWMIQFSQGNKSLYFGRFDDKAEAESVAALLRGALLHYELTKGN